MKELLVHLNGELVPESEAKISIFDAAVSLGFTVTDSARTFLHKPFKLEAHIARLYQSMKVTRIEPGISPEEMLNRTTELLEMYLEACITSHPAS